MSARPGATRWRVPPARRSQHVGAGFAQARSSPRRLSPTHALLSFVSSGETGRGERAAGHGIEVVDRLVDALAINLHIDAVVEVDVVVAGALAEGAAAFTVLTIVFVPPQPAAAASARVKLAGRRP